MTSRCQHHNDRGLASMSWRERTLSRGIEDGGYSRASSLEMVVVGEDAGEDDGAFEWPDGLMDGPSGENELESMAVDAESEAQRS